MPNAAGSTASQPLSSASSTAEAASPAASSAASRSRHQCSDPAACTLLAENIVA